MGGGGGGVLELQLLLGHASHGRRLGRGQEHRRGAARARGSCRQGRSIFVSSTGSYHVFQFLTVKQREGLRGGRRCCVRGPLGGQLVQAETAETAEGGVLAGVRGPEAGEHGEAVVICVRGACSSGA